jgi:hypothetical protein
MQSLQLFAISNACMFQWFNQCVHVFWHSLFEIRLRARQALLLFLVYAFETTRSPESAADVDSSRGDYVAPDGGAFSFAPLPLPTMHIPVTTSAGVPPFAPHAHPVAPLPTYI